MKLLKVETLDNSHIRTECELCGWSTDTSVGEAIKEVIIHIIAEHSIELPSKLRYLLLKTLRWV